MPNTTPRAQLLFVTLGCAKNEVDTDRMRARLLAAGFAEADAVDEADAVLVNTCSFLASATSESIEVTLDLAEEAAGGVRTKPIVMCGCVPSRYGSDLVPELPEVQAFVPVDEEDGIVGVVERVLGLEGASPCANAVLRTIEGASAYVKISDGCDRYCSFCAIPYIRGRYASRPYDEIASEVQALLEGGVREIVLIGQDTGVWGKDLGEGDSLASLLVRLGALAEPFDAWLRVLYLQPEGMTDELVAAIRDTPCVLPYIDIPIQHCSERVLRTMNRHGSAQQYAELFARLRREIPGMVLRSTAMAGFPGETEEESDELYAFIQAQELDYCSVFAYSQEDGTRAARMDGQVSEEVKAERTQALVDLTEQLGFAATASHVGELADVIIDGVEEGPDGVELIGHAWFQAPDSDGAVHIAQGEAAVGDKVRVRLVDSFCYELVGQIEDAAQGGTR